MDAITKTTSLNLRESFPLTKPKLVLLGATGVFIESMIPAIPFGVATSTMLIGIIVHKQLQTQGDESNQKIYIAWLGMLFTGLATLLSIGFNLDILNGQMDNGVLQTDRFGWLTSSAWFFSIVGIIGTMIHKERNGSEINWIHLTFEAFLHSVRQIWIGTKETFEFATESNEDSAPIELKGLFANLVMPIVSVGLFMMLYGGINKNFEESTSVLFDMVEWTFSNGVHWVSMLPISTLILGGAIVSLIIPTFMNRYTPTEKWMAIPNDPDDLLLLEEQLTEPNDSVEAPFNISTITPTLILLNALLVWFHIVDLSTIIGSDFSNAAVLSQNVHACLSRVFIATFASIAVLLIPSSETSKEYHKKWAKAWVVNNGIFSIWAIVKVGLYIALFGLTAKRIAILGLFIGLGLTVKACLSMLSTGKKATWIFNRAVEHQYLCLVGSSLIATLAGMIAMM
jgi:hypothetical protein